MLPPRSYHAIKELCGRYLDGLFDCPKPLLIDTLIDLAADLFAGKLADLQPCDTAFHDLDHTFEATKAVLDLLAGHKRKKIHLSARDWELASAAIIFHDTGYLKRRFDTQGSGAKYSATHVGRSCLLAWDLLPALGFNRDELRQIQNAICATSTTAVMSQLPFHDSREWLISAIVASGDVLGQMAAEDYPERLPALYLEFWEAGKFSKYKKASFAVYPSLLDLLEGTEKFYHNYVIRMLEREWRGIYHVLEDDCGVNPYIERMRLNVRRVSIMAKSLTGTRLNNNARTPLDRD